LGYAHRGTPRKQDLAPAHRQYTCTTLTDNTTVGRNHSPFRRLFSWLSPLLVALCHPPPVCLSVCPSVSLWWCPRPPRVAHPAHLTALVAEVRPRVVGQCLFEDGTRASSASSVGLRTVGGPPLQGCDHYLAFGIWCSVPVLRIVGDHCRRRWRTDRQTT
jgi:hypothetical protein